MRLTARSDEPPRMAELADRLGIVPRSLTTVIDAREKDGLVRREIDPRNRRAIPLHLTETGRRGPGRPAGARRRAAEDLFAPLSADDRTALGDLLTRVDLEIRCGHG